MTVCGAMTCLGVRAQCFSWMETSAYSPPNSVVFLCVKWELLIRYVGGMKEGQHEGQGLMQYHNGDTYSGDV